MSFGLGVSFGRLCNRERTLHEVYEMPMLHAPKIQFVTVIRPFPVNEPANPEFVAYMKCIREALLA